MKNFLFIFLFLNAIFVSAEEKQDTNLVLDLKKKAQAVLDVNLDSCLKIAMQGMQLAEKLNYEKGKAELLNTIGLVYREQGKSELALSTYNKALGIAEKNNIESTKAAILSNIGMLHEKHGDYKPALENFLAALRIREKLKDDKGIGRTLNNIALVFTEQENYSKAIEYYQRSVEFKLKSGDTVLAARTYNNMGITLVSMERYADAIAILNKALAINKRHGEEGEVTINIGNLGLAYDRSGEKNKAKEYYEKCIAAQARLKMPDVELSVPINNLGTIYLEQNNLPQAERLLKQSLEMALQRESKEDIMEAYGNLAQVYSKEKKFEKAFEVQQKFNALTDTLAKEKSGKAMAEMMVKYETEKKEEQNTLLGQENELQKLRLERNNYVISALAMFILLLITVGVLFYRQRKLKSEQERILLEQKLLRSQMNPHFIFNSLQSIQSFMLTHKPDEAAGYLSDFARLMRMILENSRKEYCSLEDIIQFNQYYLRMQTLRFENKFDAEMHVDPDLDTEHILVPPMLLQPFIENSIEHGFKNKEGKGKIDVRIYRNRDTLKLEVVDNGIGRLASEKMKDREGMHGSLAMSITRERIEALNRKSARKITLDILDLSNESNEPAGTKVIFALPMKEVD
ncbi:hypothetical protein BH11BAC1_BH11BAC1_29400 [soil metagenome]